MSLEFRAPTESDLDAVADIRVRSFGPMSDPETARFRVANLELLDQDRLFGVFDGATLAGCGKARGFEQVWHGRSVPMAGMAGVTILPEYRGRGVGTVLMRGLAERSVARGEPISALFPATVPIYRQLGWELVGGYHRYALPAAQLRNLGGGSTRPVRAATADVDRLMAICADVLGNERRSGPLLWSRQGWERRLADRDEFVYLLDDGVVVYGWDGRGADLRVDLLLARSEETLRRLWSLVGSGSSIARTVMAYLSPDDPVFWLLPEESGREVITHGWMLRILDVPGALTARGYSRALEASLVVQVDDAERPDNAGGWRLEVAGGRCHVERVTGDASTAVHLAARGLAALYAGRPMTGLRQAGLATGDERQDEGADAIFATSVPHLTDYF
ncbi:MAG TPA: GNAT family N-acetyltransferase [Pedococcus sp.]|nr:GNAT family N-acetyltransferase [Pedococcus sp.]